MLELALGGLVSLVLAAIGLAADGRGAGRRRGRLGIVAAPPPASWLGRLVGRTATGLTEGQAAALAVAAGMAVAGVFVVLRPEAWLVPVGLAVGAGGVVVALVLLGGRGQRQVRAALPGVFDQLAAGLRAGLTLEAGLRMAAADADEPLAGELRRCVGETDLGLDPATALDRLADRLAVPELDAAAAVVTAAGPAGGDLSALFDRLAAASRERAAAAAQSRAATGLVRLSAGFVAAAMPLLLGYYVLGQPEFLGDFLSTKTGWKAVGLACLLEAVGVVWLWLLLKDEGG